MAIVFLSVLGIILEELTLEELPINPTIMRVMRVLRIARGIIHINSANFLALLSALASMFLFRLTYISHLDKWLPDISHGVKWAEVAKFRAEMGLKG